ncbi:MAG: ribonuclease HII [Anaerolineae bacterium]|nr:ribonuclease HII [Anaerolineae bacterium]
MALLKQGYLFIAGFDEAGRGAWAGPVVAAAVILPVDMPDRIAHLAGLRDSKKLTAGQRERLFDVIHDVALASAVGIAEASVVDTINVVSATRQAMGEAFAALSVEPDYLLLDHIKLPAIDLPQDSFPKADNISLTVAAASVIAKVTRDRLMVEYHHTYPAYAFDRHKGYGTQRHRCALAEYGPCPLHRMSYAPLQTFI